MKHDPTTTDLVNGASMGHKDCMDQLLKLTEPRIFSYLYRLTMDFHQAQDITQQILLDIANNLWRLEKANRYWPWVYKTAWGKAQHSFRDMKKRKTISLSDVETDFLENQLHKTESKSDVFFREIDSSELFQAVYKAMNKIKFKHRAVLTMRCYEELSFVEIAEQLNTSETNARVLFYRAKNSLKKLLRKNGFKPKMLIPAIALFGMVTAKTAKAAITTTTVTSQSAHVGFIPWLIYGICTKTGIALSGLTAGVISWFVYLHAALILGLTVIIVPFIIIAFAEYASRQ